ncbi:MAG: hypothetical protein JXR95_04685 [Deltaproteobacteria bacterium]|nr:hypothetical protein [Deltaproteobacteria bacterium]
MKVFILLAIFIITGCTETGKKQMNTGGGETSTPVESSTSPGKSSETNSVSKYTPPKVRLSDNGWELYESADSYTPGNSADFNPGFSTPEGAVLYFYTSKMAGTENWKKSLIENGCEKGISKYCRRLLRKLGKSKDWKYLEVKLVGRKMVDDKMYIKVFMKINTGKPRPETGTDEATVIFQSGRWFVVAIPT